MLMFLIAIALFIVIGAVVAWASKSWAPFAPTVMTTAYLLIALGILYWLLGTHWTGILH